MTIRHTAPTAPGGRVTARAEWLGLENKLHRFKVSASDEAGKVGSGEHTRAIVDTERLSAAAIKRTR